MEVAQVVEAGEAVISTRLAARSAELTGLIGSKFQHTSLEQVATQFEATLDPEGTINQAVAELAILVREEAAKSIDDFKQAEMWIYMKAPSISDGNNFGVDVQNFVSSELKSMRHAMQGMLDGASNYHWQRGNALEKCAKSGELVTDESEVKETSDDKVTSKTAKSTKTSSKCPPQLADYRRYAAALDVKQYHASYLQLTDLRNCYIKARVLFEKNSKRLADPRGDGEGGDRGVMSMF
uniref:Proteasome activator PA28 C-terminal domain-containing protein n=1 Tax=Coccolithus braarudii TaxID=221442 RepID=A0A7S0LPP2_9EUKA|mmetsp:Transcript_47925/g.102379  ORF Transcript_47925/g.102379 Transcript_47925/m.102379 type:complete len:238 (+) Transcript_47925:67-780(+)|eukprot:CAMPEP_0183356384 /NCGR_PEP_ID=MMETSP0164_2-20130417/44205_1 /TAXON_ID=221442 /ORGANISM="Coccolithus pelagicus ssp braarudi, Strain PLY182g" /LENGTH=237 /DNA_ID=CAMNT_0025529785 /DNA_START=65 /DNA_END=778 /DNA_ORIENTATION=+